jgi:hypothetical protein
MHDPSWLSTSDVNSTLTLPWLASTVHKANFHDHCFFDIIPSSSHNWKMSIYNSTSNRIWPCLTGMAPAVLRHEPTALHLVAASQNNLIKSSSDLQCQWALDSFRGASDCRLVGLPFSPSPFNFFLTLLCRRSMHAFFPSLFSAHSPFAPKSLVNSVWACAMAFLGYKNLQVSVELAYTVVISICERQAVCCSKEVTILQWASVEVWCVKHAHDQETLPSYR